MNEIVFFTYKCVDCGKRQKVTSPPPSLIEDSMLNCDRCGFATVHTCEQAQVRSGKTTTTWKPGA